MEAHEFARAGKLFDVLAKLHRDVGQHEQAAIALHDAGAMLVSRGRNSEAFRIFTDVIRDFEKHHVYEWVRRTQVDAAAVAPNEATATSLLAAARRAAASAKDFDTLECATAQLAEQRLRRGDVDGAIRHIDMALRTMPPHLNIPLLADRFRLVLKSAHNRRIAPAFHRLVSAARSAGDRERVIDAHMQLGDYLWAKGAQEERINACQAYAVAMTEALQLDLAEATYSGVKPVLTTFIKVGMHTFGRLRAVVRHGDNRVLVRLEDTTRAWWQKQDAREGPRLARLTLWPVRLAARLCSLEIHGRRVLKRDIRAILTEELRQAFARTP